MTKDEISRVVAVWQERLGLGRWDIQVRWELPCPKGCDAEIKISDDYDQASIRIQQDDDPGSEPQTKPFTVWSAEQANRVVVHELLHIFEKQTHRPASSLDSVLSSAAFEVFWKWYQHGAESWVDRLSAVLVDLAGCA